jgi:hypothetical protein
MVHGFDRILLALLEGAFPRGAPGLLNGVSVGRPRQPKSPLNQHPQSGQLMSAASLELTFRHVFDAVRWNSSVSDYMLHLVNIKGSQRQGRRGVVTGEKRVRYRFYWIQEGFGLLMQEVGIPTLDWTSVYRAPYWEHLGITVDFTGGADNQIPIQHILFAPSQMMFTSKLRRCCRGEQCTPPPKNQEEIASASAPKVKWVDKCAISEWRNGEDCCFGGPSSNRQAVLRKLAVPVKRLSKAAFAAHGEQTTMRAQCNSLRCEVWSSAISTTAPARRPA